MDSYQRLVAYLYEYENGRKGRNVGFGRIEMQNGVLKLTLHMKSLQGRLQGGKVFLFYRDNERLSGIEVGDMVVQGNYGDFRLLTKRDNLMGSGIAFSRICGLSVGEGQHYVASEWDGKELDVAHFYHHQMIPETAETSVVEAKPQLHGETEQMEENAVSRTGEASRVETVAQPESVNQSEEKQQEAVERQEQAASDIGAAVGTVKGVYVSKPETASAMEEVVGASEPDSRVYATGTSGAHKAASDEPADALFSHCQAHTFFENEEMEYCVKMEPKDIGYLPMETWGMAGNSFLLHGYYQFHHLIFVKKRGEEGKKAYYMGVPGFYRNQDKSMAQLFGFLQFASCQGDAPMDGEFGYWLQQVVL